MNYAVSINSGLCLVRWWNRILSHVARYFKMVTRCQTLERNSGAVNCKATIISYSTMKCVEELQVQQDTTICVIPSLDIKWVAQLSHPKCPLFKKKITCEYNRAKCDFAFNKPHKHLRLTVRKPLKWSQSSGNTHYVLD